MASVANSLFSFGGQTGDPEAKFLRVKSLKSKNGLPVHAARASALEAAAELLPTKLYAGLADLHRKHKPDVTLTLTDGSPDDEASTINQIRSLKLTPEWLLRNRRDLEGRKELTEQLKQVSATQGVRCLWHSGLPNKVREFDSSTDSNNGELNV